MFRAAKCTLSIRYYYLLLGLNLAFYFVFKVNEELYIHILKWPFSSLRSPVFVIRLRSRLF